MRLASLLRPALFVATLSASVAGAQTPATESVAFGPPDVIHGKIVNDSGRALVASVIVTRGPDRLVQRATSDSGGEYSVRFEQGTGDYLVYVSATGYRPARRRVQRRTTEHDLVANFTLAIDVTLLAASKTVADRPARATNPVGPTQPEPGSSEKWSDGVNGQVSPVTAGDLNSIAGTLSNVTMTPAGPSILGSDPSSTLTTLNGMATGATTVPRAARTDTRVTATTYDATRGGFSGANIDVRLAAGNRNYQERNAYFTLNPEALAFTDPTSRSLGATTSGFRGSAAADGEVVRDALTYNLSVDYAHNVSSPQTLLDANADALIRAGASPDSVARIVALAGPEGVALSGNGVPSLRLHNGVTWLGRFDDTRDSLNRRTLTTYVGYTSDGAVGFSALEAPSASGQRSQRTLGGQFVQDLFVGPGKRILNETRASIGGTHTDLSPYRELPGAQILLRSADTSAGEDFTPITLGGGSAFSNENGNWFGEAADQTWWNAGGRRHHFSTLAWARADGLRQSGGGNLLGTFTFNSIDDFAANTPTSFSRTLVQPASSGDVWNSALAFSHQYAPTRFFSLIEGARVEADGFSGAPPVNPALDAALGTHSGAAPWRMHVSPRFGFSYTYNRDRDNGNGLSISSTGRYFRTTTGVIRGGIGEFRDLLQPGLFANANAATGLPGGASSLSCVGSATPVPDWSAFSADPSSIPTSCVGGSNGVLAQGAPNVALIDPSYDVPRSWRASLDWSTNVGRWLFQASALGSYDLNQPGTVNENFAGTPQFTLADEGNRPVFVPTAAIDPNSGSVSSASARRVTQFGAVNDRVSDLHGQGEQLTVRLSPDVFKFRSRVSFYTSASYTLQQSRRQYRGFDGSGFGDPNTIEWAPSNNDARHVVVLSGGLFAPKVGTFTLFARVQSGLPFTPIVSGDANGDGVSGDRAFMPNPAQIQATDSSLAAQLRNLLLTGSPTAKSCLRENLGAVVARNGCRGPWTESLNAQWSPPIPVSWRNRITPVIYFENVLAGIDQLVHGVNNMSGWGTPAAPDPVLLVPRGFDATSREFQYDVNARFAETRPGRTTLVNPFRIVIDFSLNLTTDPSLQQLRRAVEPVHTPAGRSRRSADSLTAFYLRQTSSIYKLIIDQSDSLFLSTAQLAALGRADSSYSAQVRAIYRPLADFLSRGNGDAGKAELDSVTASTKAYWKVFWAQPEIADSLITPTQKSLLPIMVSLVGVQKEDREHSQFFFGSPVTLTDKKAPAAPDPAALKAQGKPPTTP